MNWGLFRISNVFWRSSWYFIFCCESCSAHIPARSIILFSPFCFHCTLQTSMPSQWHQKRFCLWFMKRLGAYWMYLWFMKSLGAFDCLFLRLLFLISANQCSLLTFQKPKNNGIELFCSWRGLELFFATFPLLQHLQHLPHLQQCQTLLLQLSHNQSNHL